MGLHCLEFCIGICSKEEIEFFLNFAHGRKTQACRFSFFGKTLFLSAVGKGRLHTILFIEEKRLFYFLLPFLEE